MSFFDKMKVSVGIGNAKVDTRIDKKKYTAGEEVTGHVFILGGKVDQEINNVFLNVVTKVEKETDDNTYYQNTTIHRVKVESSFTIKKEQELEIPFSFILPIDTPITLGDVKVWINTELDVSFSIDPRDNDYIEVVANKTNSSVMQAMEEMGFKLRKVKSIPFRNSIGVGQKLEYVPTHEYQNDLDELEIIFVTEPNGLSVYMEIDKKAKGLGGLINDALDMDESKVSTFFSNDILSNIESTREAFSNTIEKYI